jgi:hypothetical protein
MSGLDVNKAIGWEESYEESMRPLYLIALCSELPTPGSRFIGQLVDFDPVSLRMKNQTAWQKARIHLPSNPSDLCKHAEKVNGQGRWREG